MRIEHTVECELKLNAIKYVYWINDNLELVLDEYTTLRRETRRHKYIPIKKYRRVGSTRENNINIEDISIPSKIEDIILEKTKSRIKFKQP